MKTTCGADDLVLNFIGSSINLRTKSPRTGKPHNLDVMKVIKKNNFEPFNRKKM